MLCVISWDHIQSSVQISDCIWLPHLSTSKWVSAWTKLFSCARPNTGLVVGPTIWNTENRPQSPERWNMIGITEYKQFVPICDKKLSVFRLSRRITQVVAYAIICFKQVNHVNLCKPYIWQHKCFRYVLHREIRTVADWIHSIVDGSPLEDNSAASICLKIIPVGSCPSTSQQDNATEDQSEFRPKS